MSVLSRYIVREFAKLLVLCESVFVFIYLTVHFFGRIDNFIESSVPAARIVAYFLYEIPYIAVQMLAPATLIGVIILLGIMRRNNEIVALKASGLDILGILKPLIAASLCLSAGIFLTSEIVVPYTTSKSNEIWRIDVRKRDPGRFYGRNHIWYKTSRCIYWIRDFDSQKNCMQDVTIYFFDSSFHVVKRIDARRGIWKDGKWKMEDGIILKARKDKSYGVRRFDQVPVDLPETPQTFTRGERKPEEMGYWELKRFAEQVHSEGYEARQYLVDLHIKIAFPFITVLMVLLATPVGLRQIRGGIPVAVSCGMVLCFLYLLVLGLSRSFGLAGILPPLLSAWLANGIFFFLGTYLIIHLDR